MTASAVAPPSPSPAPPPSQPTPFDDLYADHAPTIYARCRQILRDREAAEDATQEVFFRIYPHLERLSSRREALAWMYRTATNYCLNEVRNGRTRAALIKMIPIPVGPDSELGISQQDLLMRLILGLPAELALVAWLYHVDGLEQAEIGEICGVSRRTVITRLQRFSEQARIFLKRSDAP